MLPSLNEQFVFIYVILAPSMCILVLCILPITLCRRRVLTFVPGRKLDRAYRLTLILRPCVQLLNLPKPCTPLLSALARLHFVLQLLPGRIYFSGTLHVPQWLTMVWVENRQPPPLLPSDLPTFLPLPRSLPHPPLLLKRTFPLLLP